MGETSVGNEDKLTPWSSLKPAKLGLVLRPPRVVIFMRLIDSIFSVGLAASEIVTLIRTLIPLWANIGKNILGFWIRLIIAGEIFTPKLVIGPVFIEPAGKELMGKLSDALGVITSMGFVHSGLAPNAVPGSSQASYSTSKLEVAEASGKLTKGVIVTV